MATITVFNSSGRAQVYDSQGHTLGEGEWTGPVDSLDPVTRGLLDSGFLTKVTRPDGKGAKLSPGAAAAFDATDAATAEASAAKTEGAPATGTDTAGTSRRSN